MASQCKLTTSSTNCLDCRVWLHTKRQIRKLGLRVVSSADVQVSRWSNQLKLIKFQWNQGSLLSCLPLTKNGGTRVDICRAQRMRDWMHGNGNCYWCFYSCQYGSLPLPETWQYSRKFARSLKVKECREWVTELCTKGGSLSPMTTVTCTPTSNGNLPLHGPMGTLQSWTNNVTSNYTIAPPTSSWNKLEKLLVGICFTIYCFIWRQHSGSEHCRHAP